MFGFMFFFFPPTFFWGEMSFAFLGGASWDGWMERGWRSWSLLGPPPVDWISFPGLPSPSPSGEPAEPNKGKD